MLLNKNFITSDGTNTSCKSFKVTNGLQQGTVNAPLLFKIYTANLLKLFGLNDDIKIKAIAFADDIIIYIIGDKVSVIQDKLQTIFHKIQTFFNSWKLKINTDKCETILFRPLLKNTNNDVKKHWKTFHITTSKSDKTPITHKQLVKYLDVHLDPQLKLFNHIDTQMNNSFNSLSRLFYCKYLKPTCKVLCYLSLNRPILTYACPIWYNIPNYKMEKLRLFERHCRRACLTMFRTERSNYKKHYRNLIDPIKYCKHSKNRFPHHPNLQKSFLQSSI